MYISGGSRAKVRVRAQKMAGIRVDVLLPSVGAFRTFLAKFIFAGRRKIIACIGFGYLIG